MKTTTVLCIFLLFALLSLSDAARGLRRLEEEVKPTKASAAGGDATTNSVAGPQHCQYYWDCYWTNIPGIGEEEICNQVQVCT